MRQTRRVTALLVTFLLIHLTWVGSGFACVMPAMAHTPAVTAVQHAPPSADMAGMHMDGASVETSPSTPAHHDLPCRFPWAPDGCQSIAPCAPLAVASAVADTRVPHETPSAVAPQLVLTPPSRTTPPELPPPRA